MGELNSRRSLFPYRAPIPVGPNTLWPEKTNQSQSSCCMSTRMCETDCAPSTSTRAPTRCAISIICRAGVTVPSAFETWESDTTLVREPSSFWYSSSSICPSLSTGATRSLAPTSLHNCCQGTILAWCSSQVITISSPSLTFCRPQL